MPESSFDKIKDIADCLIYETTGKHLSDVEVLILEGSWQHKTYDEIAEESCYSPVFLRQDVGYGLWRKLSNALGEKVKKASFREALGRTSNTVPDIQKKLEFPEGSVPLSSSFYIDSGEELNCCEQILKPGSLIRIRGPRLTGKTSLVNRIVYSEHHNYERVCLNLDGCNEQTLGNLNDFLYWFCIQAGRQLNLESHLTEWDTQDSSVNNNCTDYFEDYVLPKNNAPVILSLDNVDRLFAYPEVIRDFSRLLRSWHDKQDNIWKQLRLILAYSTETYIPLDIHNSPFENVGYPVELQDFDKQKVHRLAQLHRLEWDDLRVEKLMGLVGGHPYLVRLALYKIATQELTLEQLLNNTSPEDDIYGDHLRRLWEALNSISELADVYKQVVNAVEPLALDPRQIYQLHRRGLIQKSGKFVTPRCRLIQQYFATYL
jgi:AAA-like domain